MKRYPYFDEGEGLSCHIKDLKEQMRVIAYRYVGDNAPLPCTVRRMPEDHFRQEKMAAIRSILRKSWAGVTMGMRLPQAPCAARQKKKYLSWLSA